ncbi:MAG: LuxR family transcriptional regulator, partial [Parvularcula sp.]|nr:LuxR family transcriptional regulator [Parvularcula sp.]
MTELLPFVAKVYETSSFSRVARLSIDFLREKNVRMMSYHHLPPIGAFDYSGYLQVMAVGFPRDWVQEYVREGYDRIDPIPRAALTAAQPFWWSNVHELVDVDAEEEAYLARLSGKGLGNGIAVPVFGPHGRSGYVGLGCGHIAKDDGPSIYGLQLACQAAHLRYCVLLQRQLPEGVTLSEREREILAWIARGKSNSVIAEILDLSPNTVDTYIRRVFRKLQVADRVTA